VIAIEPLAECWQTWPRENPRLIGIPAAISLERGAKDFHVNAADATSSLAESEPNSSVAALTRTIEVRKVPVLRLEDILALVPAHIAIESLKTDVQGLDLQVLKSAGEQLRRVGVVKAEVINEAIYKKLGDEAPATEGEFVTYMAKMGFRFGGDLDVAEGRRWLDKLFINNAFSPPQPEAGKE
jgi:FkbM family methyltransferase